MKKNLSVAVVGAGMGGLAVAATLQRVGIEVQVYDQAARFGRIGACRVGAMAARCSSAMPPHPMTPYMAQGAATDAARTSKAPSSATRLTAGLTHRFCRRSPARTPGCGRSAAATPAGFTVTTPGTRSSISLLHTCHCRLYDQSAPAGRQSVCGGRHAADTLQQLS
jgi:glycine/D-amino acid oxidase-like deaminating enzyme